MAHETKPGRPNPTAPAAGKGAPAHKPSDEELLAAAIPIDVSAEEELEAIEEPVILEESEQDKIDNINEGERPKARTEAEAGAIELVDTVPEGPSRIKRSDYGASHRQTVWNRQPNKDGRGATHCKTFVVKLRMDAIENLDAQINEWLDAHPELEVKFSTSAIGVLVGKINEPAMFIQVWV
jgi:hypothetical protein